MKTIKNILSIALISMLGLAVTSCTDGNDWDVDGSFARLFSLNNDKISVETEDVQATVTFNSVPDAEYYIIEVSTDSLYDDIPMGQSNAIIYGEDKSITKSPVVLENLAGDTKYYLRIKAMAENKNDSKWSYYMDGDSFKTKAEQIFNDVSDADRFEDRIRLSWIPGAEVTHIVYGINGENGARVDLSETDKQAGEITITGLAASTSYTFIIYNGEVKRGSVTTTTTAAMPDGDYKIELTADITRISGALLDEIVEDAKAATGKETNLAITVGLRPDMTYSVASLSDEGTDANLFLPDGLSITFFGLSGGKTPVMNMLKSLDIAGSHSYIRFENVAITDGGCQYLINQSSNATIGEMSFYQCTFSDFERSVIRTQGSGVISIDNIIVDDCVMSNMSTGNGYSVFYFGTATTLVGKLELKNSTFDTTQRSFIETSKAPITNGVYITNCTFYNNVGSGGRYFFDANGQNTDLVIKNTILGKTNAADARGARTAGTMTFDNCLRTSDCIYTSNDIKDLEADERSSADVFKDPDNHDFTLKINDKLGDPRWYPAE